MRNVLSALVVAAWAMSMTLAVAAERTLTFAVENMTCATCPYVVKTSMAAVPGVLQVNVSFEAKTATVTFDDAVTDPEAIAEASTNAGYSARRVEQGS